MRFAACLLVAFVCPGVATFGQSDDVIVAKIQEAPSVDFSLETDDLVNLKEAGVKPELLAGMIARASVTQQNARPKPDKPHLDLDVDFVLGMKSMENAWEPVDDQVELGVALSIGPDNWPVDIAVDSLYTKDGGCNWLPYVCLEKPATGKTFEVDAGVRKIWRSGKVLPYMGAGVATIRAAFEITDGSIYAKSSDVALGYWAGMGLLFRSRQAGFEFGFDVRYSTANVALNFGHGTQSADAGGFHYGLLFGFGL